MICVFQRGVLGSRDSKQHLFTCSGSEATSVEAEILVLHPCLNTRQHEHVSGWAAFTGGQSSPDLTSTPNRSACQTFVHVLLLYSKAEGGDHQDVLQLQNFNQFILKLSWRLNKQTLSLHFTSWLHVFTLNWFHLLTSRTNISVLSAVKEGRCSAG